MILSMCRIFPIWLFQILPLLLLSASLACADRQVTYGRPVDEVRRGFVQVIRELGGEVHNVDKMRMRVRLPDADFLLTFSQAGQSATMVEVGSKPEESSKALTVKRMILNLVSSRLAKRRSLEFAESSSVLRHYTRATVCIYGTRNGESLQMSGFTVSSHGLVLTTAHDLDSTTSVVVQSYDGSVAQGRVFVLDPAFDLAVISTGLKTPDFIDVRSLDVSGIPSTGTRVWTLGCPLGLSETSARGIIAAPPRLMGNILLYQSDLPVYPGSSGSPVFDSSGRLLAVVKGRIRGHPKISFLIPGFYARTLFFRIKGLLANYSDQKVKGGGEGADIWFVRALAATGYREKEHALLKSIDLDPGFELALYHLGILYSSKPDKIGLEENVWERLARLEPHWGEVYFRLGNCLLRQGRLADARLAYNHALEYLKEDPRVFNNLGEVLRRLGRVGDARRAFRKALSCNPDYPLAHFNLGVLYEQDLKNPEKAIYHYKQYLRLMPEARDAVKVEKWISKLEAGL